MNIIIFLRVLMLSISIIGYSVCAFLCLVLFKKMIGLSIRNKNLLKTEEYSLLHFAWFEKKSLNKQKIDQIKNQAKVEYAKYWGVQEIDW